MYIHSLPTEDKIEIYILVDHEEDTKKCDMCLSLTVHSFEWVKVGFTYS